MADKQAWYDSKNGYVTITYTDHHRSFCLWKIWWNSGEGAGSLGFTSPDSLGIGPFPFLGLQRLRVSEVVENSEQSAMWKVWKALRMSLIFTDSGLDHSAMNLHHHVLER